MISHKKSLIAWLGLISLTLCSTVSFGADVKVPRTVILVDKKTHNLYLANYRDEGYEILKTYKATLGKVKGDKEDEGDLKTPEGIYPLTQYLTPPTLKPKFGIMAFYVGYPNFFDKMAGYTGNDIMLHATDNPERLKKAFDSEGCIVLRNEELQELRPFIKVNLTPILIFSELTEEFKKPTGDQALIDFFNRWIHAWETKEISQYIDSYHSEFEQDGKNKEQWRDYKNTLNLKYSRIEVKPEKVQYFRHPKYSMIQFVQNYKSYLAHGRPGHVSRGTKSIWVAEEDGKMKIIAEDFTQSTW